MKILVEKLDSQASLPSFAHPGDAGMDFFSMESAIIKPNERITCSTGIAVQIPKGYVGLIWDKSGLASKNGIKTMGGVVDSGYRGEIKIVIINLSDTDYEIKKGEKIAQMLIQKVENPEIIEVENLDETQRGEGGFGSTGITGNF
jgi:dUTP pyrophosphatase